MIVSTYRVLSFDPGESTGIAYMRDRALIWASTAMWDAFNDLEYLPCLCKMCRPTHILLEGIPTTFPNNTQRNVYNEVLRYFTVAGVPVIIINPGQWKNFVPPTKIKSTHMQDATMMATWFMKKEMSNVR